MSPAEGRPPLNRAVPYPSLERLAFKFCPLDMCGALCALSLDCTTTVASEACTRHVVRKGVRPLCVVRLSTRPTTPACVIRVWLKKSEIEPHTQ
jgi:hypothetical protein